MEVLELSVFLLGPLVLVHRIPGVRLALLVSLAVGCLRYLTLGLPEAGVSAVLADGESLASTGWDVSLELLVLIGLLSVALLLAFGFYLSLRSSARLFVAPATSAASIILLLFAYIRIEQIVSSLLFAWAALLLAMIFELIARRVHGALEEDETGRMVAVSSYLISSVVSLTLAAIVAFQGPALTVSLGIVTAAAAFAYLRYPLSILRVFSLISLVPYVVHLIAKPLIDPVALETSIPIFNPLLLGYGIPALGIMWAAWQLSRSKADIWAEGLQVAAIVLWIATVSILSLHAIDPTFTFSSKQQRILSITALVIIGGCFSLGMTRLSRGSKSRIQLIGADVLCSISMVVGVLGLGFYSSPLLDGRPPGGVNVGDSLFFSVIHFGYLVPSLLFGSIVVFARDSKPQWLTGVTWGFVILLGSLWVSMCIRHIFSPGFLQSNPVEQSELYIYSVAWLCIGLVVLALGIGLRISILRAGSGLIFVLVTLKVFLIDLSALEGILRAISFIGLGLVLLAIGLVYQRALAKILPSPALAQEDGGEPDETKSGW